MSDRIHAHVYVSGKVQGVFYRANTRDTARSEAVAGWVKNLDDGRVEAVFEGDKDAVETLVEWCHTGSSQADVAAVEATYKEPIGLSGFEIRR
ncbi:acylphosphatase [Halorubraceae archaeon YAN]|nr:acylphosphatase [Halorubraceae archaeon YAN]